VFRRQKNALTALSAPAIFLSVIGAKRSQRLQAASFRWLRGNTSPSLGSEEPISVTVDADRLGLAFMLRLLIFTDWSSTDRANVAMFLWVAVMLTATAGKPNPKFGMVNVRRCDDITPVCGGDLLDDEETEAQTLC
jgi:hypothetical protein